MNKPAANDITFEDFIKATEKLVTSPPKETKWLSPADTCDLCGQTFDKSCVKYLNTENEKRDFFVDGRTKRGPWALMCGTCHQLHGVGFGTGFGQAYDLETRIKITG